MWLLTYTCRKSLFHKVEVFQSGGKVKGGGGGGSEQGGFLFLKSSSLAESAEKRRLFYKEGFNA